MQNSMSAALLILVFAIAPSVIQGSELVLAPYFGDNMVLQQARGKSHGQRETLVWGWSGEKIRLELELRQSGKTAYSTRDVGWAREKSTENTWRWTAAFRDLASGGPFTLRISSPSERTGISLIEHQNVAIGEVWVLSRWLPIWSPDPSMPRDLPMRASTLRDLETECGPLVRATELENLPSLTLPPAPRQPWRELRDIDPLRDGLAVFDLEFGRLLLEGSQSSVQYVGIIHLPDVTLKPIRPWNAPVHGAVDSGYSQSIDWAFDSCFKAWSSLSEEYKEFEARYRTYCDPSAAKRHASRTCPLPLMEHATECNRRGTAWRPFHGRPARAGVQRPWHNLAY